MKNHSWGVYPVYGRLPGGKETKASDKKAVSYGVRWRVNGQKPRRSFSTRGHARAWYDELSKAQLLGWPADDRGWPIDPASLTEGSMPSTKAAGSTTGRSFEDYVNKVWWPIIGSTLGDKNRIGHRANIDMAIRLLTVRDGDPRLGPTVQIGASIPLTLLNADDIKQALVARQGINERTAAANRRRIAAARAAGLPASSVVLREEVAGDATVRSFYVTLGMAIRAAREAGEVTGDPMQGAQRLAPKPKATKVSARLVPSIDELHDLADAIAQLGPRMPDGRPAGERFRSLILCAGTLGPRPGELVAHQPDWIDWDKTPPEVRFHQTEAAVYGAELTDDERGRRTRGLKHRDEDDWRVVPLTSDVRDALRLHIERGYALEDRTWSSPTGGGHLDWGNLNKVYWRPALTRVFAGTAKADLVNAAPKILRKTAITWWSDRGISSTLAAEWAGHSEEVQRIYYASRSQTTYQHEVDLLEGQPNVSTPTSTRSPGTPRARTVRAVS